MSSNKWLSFSLLYIPLPTMPHFWCTDTQLLRSISFKPVTADQGFRINESRAWGRRCRLTDTIKYAEANNLLCILRGIRRSRLIIGPININGLFLVHRALNMFVSTQNLSSHKWVLIHNPWGFRKRHIGIPKYSRDFRVEHERHGQWWAL